MSAISFRYLRLFLQEICTNFVRFSNFCPLFGGVRYSGCPLIRGFTVFWEQVTLRNHLNLYKGIMVDEAIISWLLWSAERQCSTTVCLFHCRNTLKSFIRQFLWEKTIWNLAQLLLPKTHTKYQKIRFLSLRL